MLIYKFILRGVMNEIIITILQCFWYQIYDIYIRYIYFVFFFLPLLLGHLYLHIWGIYGSAKWKKKIHKLVQIPTKRISLPFLLYLKCLTSTSTSFEFLNFYPKTIRIVIWHIIRRKKRKPLQFNYGVLLRIYRLKCTN